MTLRDRLRVAAALPRPAEALRLSGAIASLALLSACAGASHGPVATGYSTDYYLSHAASSYSPPGPRDDPWGPYINIAAARFDVPAPWIRQVMRAESGGHEYLGGQLTVSAAGAMGLMQLEPETYQEMAARYGLGADPFNPYNNIMAGTAYIHEMYQVYGCPGFLAAYDAGPGRLDRYMNYHTRLPDETINYVAMIAPRIQGYYPNHRSDADELALNTEPASEAPGLLPPGYIPEAPGPQAPDNPIAPVQVAALTPPAEPEASVLESAPVTTALVAAPIAPAPQPVSAPVSAPPPPVFQPHPSFSIIPAAMADTPPVRHTDMDDAPDNHFDAAPIEHLGGTPMERVGGTPLEHVGETPLEHVGGTPMEHIGWAIQVGAYDTSANARAALGIAELSAMRMLIQAHPTVVSVHAAGRLWYRARFVGLPHDAAIDACSRLSGGPTGCVVLSPAAQS